MAGPVFDTLGADVLQAKNVIKPNHNRPVITTDRDSNVLNLIYITSFCHSSIYHFDFSLLSKLGNSFYQGLEVRRILHYNSATFIPRGKEK
jgi:hypothetical protein